MINWQYFPKSDKAPETTEKVVDAFCLIHDQIDSRTRPKIEN